MKINLKKNILNHLKKLGLKKNDKLLVYSDLSRFGLNDKKLPSIVISSLKKIIGNKGTIIMPFYIFEDDKKFIFNKKKFEFTSKIGSLTKSFCKEKNLVRSNCLIHNHIGIGSQAKILKLSNERISLGKKSDFEFMMINDFKLLLLGCNAMQGATYLHHLEALYEVPYRKWINVIKKKVEKRKIKNVSVRYFAKKNNKFISNFNHVFEQLSNIKKFIKIDKIKYGRSSCIKLKDLHNFSLSLLKKNKYSLVKKKIK
jgi:aminoglycoside N3'-acetyltransferase